MPVRSFWHWSSVSVIEAQAFDPLLFTGVTQIRPTEQMRYIDTPCGPNLQTFEVEFGLDPGFVQERSRQALNYCWHVYWADWPQKFDYLIRINPTDLPASFDPYIAERRRSSFFELIKIAK